MYAITLLKILLQEKHGLRVSPVNGRAYFDYWTTRRTGKGEAQVRLQLS
jgi:hypothetical protein